jgi:hypothetical protein
MSTRAPQQHATILTHDDAAQEAAQYATTLSNLQPGQIIRTSSGQTFQLADASAMGMVGANGASFVTLQVNWSQKKTRGLKFVQEVPSTKTEMTVADGQELSVARTVTLSTAEWFYNKPKTRIVTPKLESCFKGSIFNTRNWKLKARLSKNEINNSTPQA